MPDTPYSAEFDDIYFDADNGLAESRYVFLEQNHLPQNWKDKKYFTICETGFGTGLNFLCAWTEFEKTAEDGQHLTYYSFEKFPLSPVDIQKYLAHWSHEFGGRLKKLCTVYPLRIGGWHKIEVSPYVTLILIFDDMNRALPQLDTPVDCWFLDGHAPAKNPDMWTDILFQNMARISQTGATFSTFTAAGFVRRGLEQVGFTVRKERGFGVKRDMTVGVFGQSTHSPYQPSPLQKIAVIGGGIAGASVASSLHSRGCCVTIFEKTGIASGGSGNSRGLCNPRITATRGGEADFYSPGFQRALSLIKKISETDDVGFMQSGSLHLINDTNKEKRFSGFLKNWGWHTNHVRLLSAKKASEIAGVTLHEGGLYMPDAASVSPKILTEILASGANLIKKEIGSISECEGGWMVDGTVFDAVILAGGFDVLRFEQVAKLPLQKIRGQVTIVNTTQNYNKLKINLCYSGYASVAVDGQAVIGSTFQSWVDDDFAKDADNLENISNLESVSPDLAKDLEIIGARASFRCAAHDRAPVIGRVKGYKNLWISTGHGSHGIVSSIMGAEFLATDMCGDPQILPSSVTHYLSPSRFKILRR